MSNESEVIPLAALEANLNSPESTAYTLELFSHGRLVARALPPPALRGTGFDFSRLDGEMSLMVDLPKHRSTTLLIPGENVPTYKAVGFLLDSQDRDIVIEDVADDDSGSGTDGEDNHLVASPTTLSTLAELASSIRATHPGVMNEVNVTLSSSAVRGLFALATPKNRRPQFEAALMQQHLVKMGYPVLPIFIYDDSVGTLEALQSSPEETALLIKGTIESMSSQLMRDTYTRALNSL